MGGGRSGIWLRSKGGGKKSGWIGAGKELSKGGGKSIGGGRELPKAKGGGRELEEESCWETFSDPLLWGVSWGRGWGILWEEGGLEGVRLTGERGVGLEGLVWEEEPSPGWLGSR